MEASPARACPSCSAPAQASQRWCLECGAEIAPSRRGGLGPAVGIATTLAVLLAATSAGGYTLLQDGKEPPPPPATVAQAPPPAATIPPATQEPAPYVPPSDPTPLPSTPGTTGSTGSTGGTSSTTTGGAGGEDEGSGDAGEDEDGTDAGGAPDEPQLALVDIALGAVAVAYAPYAGDDVDLGDASRVVDGSLKTAWKTPRYDDPATHPQLGVYVDLAGRETLRRLVIRTSTPGIGIEVYGARKGPPATILDEGWDHIATRLEIEQEEKVRMPDRPFRYVLVWVTGLPPEGGRAAISEISLISLQPE